MQKQKNRQKQIQISDIVQLVDDSFRLDVSIKENKKILDKNKDKLKQLALKEGKAEFSGELGECQFMSDTKTEIDPKALYTLLVELGQEDIFFDLISVKLTDTRARVGDMMLENIWKQTVKKNSKIKFKKRG